MLASDIGWSEKKVNASDIIKMLASDIGWSDRKVIASEMIKMYASDIGWSGRKRDLIWSRCMQVTLIDQRRK